MKQTDQQNVPTLRFPEFEGGWTVQPIEELGRVIRGASPRPKGDKRYYGGNVPRLMVEDVTRDGKYVTPRIDFLTADGAKLSRPCKAGTLTIVCSGTVGVPSILAVDACIHDGFLALVDVSDGVDIGFLYTNLLRLKEKFDASATHGGVFVNLTTSILREFEVSLPPLSEQKKLAEFLGAIEFKITQLTEKQRLLRDYKNGCMQQLFSQKIRFTDDSGNDFSDWEYKPLGKIADRVKQKNTMLNVTNVLTNSAVHGVISQGDYFDHDVANAENLDRYSIVRLDDFVYNPRISASAPVGPIKRNTLREGVMSPLYEVFRFSEGEVLEFWEHYYSAKSWHKYMKLVANYGARHDRMAISSSDFFDMPLPYPHPDEQRKIADFLSALDRKIDLVGQELNHAHTFKQGLLQQMFV